MFNTKLSEKLIASIHLYQKYEGSKGPVGRLLCGVGKLRHKVYSVLTGSDIRREAQVPLSVRFPHPTGVVIHQDTVIGEGCLIMQQVTLGQTDQPGAPTVGEGVYFGAGAKVLGKVSIGARARIGANAVVLIDVPDDATAVGIPARIIQRGSSSDMSNEE